MASVINTHHFWYNSNTKDVLTSYSEGLARDNFDNKKHSNIYRNTSLFWFVLNKEVGTSPIIYDSASIIRFDRVRIAQIDKHEFMP